MNKSSRGRKLGQIHGRVLEIDERVGMPVGDLDSSKESTSPWTECVREKRIDGEERHKGGGFLIGNGWNSHPHPPFLSLLWILLPESPCFLDSLSSLLRNLSHQFPPPLL